MAFPKTFDELQAANYRFDNHSRCRACDAEMEWWITPKGKKMPFNLMPAGDSPAVAHFVTCPEADSFRRG